MNSDTGSGAKRKFTRELEAVLRSTALEAYYRGLVIGGLGGFVFGLAVMWVFG